MVRPLCSSRIAYTSDSPTVVNAHTIHTIAGSAAHQSTSSALHKHTLVVLLEAARVVHAHRHAALGLFARAHVHVRDADTPLEGSGRHLLGRITLFNGCCCGLCGVRALECVCNPL